MGPFLSGDMSSLGRTHLLRAGAGDAENGDECRLGPSSPPGLLWDRALLRGSWAAGCLL